MTTLTKNRNPGDLLPHVESLEYCTKTCHVRNATGATVSIDDVVGWPLIAGTSGAGYNLAKATDEANVIALIVDGPVPLDLSNNTTSAKSYQVLVHPPAIINKNGIPTSDAAGSAFTLATIVTALEALKYEFRNDPTKTSTQTT